MLGAAGMLMKFAFGRLWILLATATVAFATPSDGQVRIRHPEGGAHGFLLLYGPGGDRIAQGDLLRTSRGHTVDARLVFYFDDGSLRDERVTFTQDSVFRMQSYALLQRGPAFDEDLEAWLDARQGTYRVVRRGHDEQDELETHTGK